MRWDSVRQQTLFFISEINTFALRVFEGKCGTGARGYNMTCVASCIVHNNPVWFCWTEVIRYFRLGCVTFRLLCIKGEKGGGGSFCVVKIAHDIHNITLYLLQHFSLSPCFVVPNIVGCDHDDDDSDKCACASHSYVEYTAGTYFNLWRIHYHNLAHSTEAVICGGAENSPPITAKRRCFPHSSVSSNIHKHHDVCSGVTPA